MGNDPGKGPAVPEGFVPVPTPEADASEMKVIEAERWKHGATVVYHGLREWTGGRGERFRAHAVGGVNDDSGAVYGVWATAVLDRMLAAVPKGETIFLRYDGLEPHPTLPDRSIHRWTVARSKKAPPVAPKPEPEGLPFK